jgi:prepilin-type N-terminal cleavage/methylation domain-containing protein
MKQRGITLIELVVVTSVVSILTAVIYISFEGWMERYEVEKITKELYYDLMDARVMAMERNEKYLTVLGDYQYTMAEDRDGDGDIDNAEVLPGFPKNVKYKLEWNYASSAKVVCDTRGFMTPNRTISVIPWTDADFDCMKISRTRIITGKYDNDSNECMKR